MKFKYSEHNPLFLNEIMQSFNKMKPYFSQKRQIKYRKKQDSKKISDADSIQDDTCWPEYYLTI